MKDKTYPKLIKACVAVIVASMDIISVVVFARPYMLQAITLYVTASVTMIKVRSLLAIAAWTSSLLSVFIVSYLSTYRNTDKVSDLLTQGSLSQRVISNKVLLTFILSFLLAITAFITQSFAIMVLLPSSSYIVMWSHTFLPAVYAIYTLLNSYADMERSTKELSYPKKNPVKGLVVFLKMPLLEQLLIILLVIASIVTCHFKLTRVTLGLVSLADRHGGIYHLLEGAKRLFFFPVLAIGFNNAGRCRDKVKQLFSQDQNSFYLQDYLGLGTILLASYTYAVSSKLLDIAPQQFVGLLFIDRAFNGIRQCSNLFSCNSKKSHTP